MARLNWTEQSIEDLLNIAEYISKDSVKYAKIQVNRIRARAQILKDFPLSGRIVPEIQDSQIKEVILGNYRIIYLIENNVVNILTVHHSSKRLHLD